MSYCSISKKKSLHSYFESSVTSDQLSLVGTLSTTFSCFTGASSSSRTYSNSTDLGLQVAKVILLPHWLSAASLMCYSKQNQQQVDNRFMNHYTELIEAGIQKRGPRASSAIKGRHTEEARRSLCTLIYLSQRISTTL